MTFASAERAYLTPPDPIECECDPDDCTCEQDAQDAKDDAAIERGEWAREDAMLDRDADGWGP